MTDLFTHMLVGYCLATVLSWHVDWITPPLVTLAMGGAILPDLNRIDLLVSDELIATMLGIPFSWMPLHRVGGTLLVVCLGALLTSARHRRAVFALLALGASSHYTLDFLLYKPSGVSSPLLWPFITHGFAIDGIFVSTDRWPAAVALLAAATVWLVDRRRASYQATHRDS
ncbi:hypothetical protein GCM10027435_02610 [Haloparvum alkalitolerans]|uniref:metal-dependent hydrolase n=1 Tax=Haloparvum alkalitolerans TaxID=1042953 RepID=UPI003CE75EF0